MSDLFDFGFDDPAPEEVKPRPAPPAPAAPPTKCQRRARASGYRCRVGGGDACFSDDSGRSWFCGPHAPRGFFPSDRQENARG